MKAVEITCRIKQENISFILRETQHYRHHHNSHNCNHLSDSGLDTIIKDYVTSDLKAGTKPQFVETPPLPE
jgi:hypothetical protein